MTFDDLTSHEYYTHNVFWETDVLLWEFSCYRNASYMPQVVFCRDATDWWWLGIGTDTGFIADWASAFSRYWKVFRDKGFKVITSTITKHWTLKTFIVTISYKKKKKTKQTVVLLFFLFIYLLDILHFFIFQSANHKWINNLSNRSSTDPIYN